MPKYPKRQIGQFTGPGWRVAPPSAGGSVSGAGKQQADRMQAFSAFSQSLAGAMIPIGKERTKEDIKKAQQFVVENEGVWRDLERSGDLDWTPPMMRAAWNMEGELAGQEFITGYQAAIGALSMEEASDIEAPKRIYDDMMRHHLSTDKRRNTEFDDGFSKYAINVGRQHVSAYTVAAAKNAKAQGIFTLGLITKNTVLEGLSMLDGIDPNRPEYGAMAEQAKDNILYDLTLLANGTRRESESGTIDTGAYGSGFWTADRGLGAATFLNSILEVAQQGVVDPQILLDVVEEISVGPHKLAGIETMQVALSEYKAEGGPLDQATSKWHSRVTEGRHGARSAYEVLKHSAGLMAADGEEEALAQTLPKLYAAIPNLYFGEEMWREYTALGQLELDVLEYEEDRIRIAQEKELASATEAKVRGHQTNWLKGMSMERFLRVSGNADPLSLADSDSREDFITEQKNILGSGWSRAQIGDVMDTVAFDHLRGLSETLNTGEARDTNGNLLDTRALQVKNLSDAMRNFSYNNNKMVPKLATYYRDLYNEFLRTGEDPDAFLSSPQGLALTAVVTAGAALQGLGELGTAMDTGAGAGNNYQALSFPVGKDPSHRDVEDALIQLLKSEGAGTYTLDEWKEEFRVISASGDTDIGPKKPYYGAGKYGYTSTSGGGYGAIKRALRENLPETMQDVEIHEWMMSQMMQDVRDEANRLYGQGDYENNMEAAINQAVKVLGPTFTGVTTENDHGFFAHKVGLHPWLQQIEGETESFTKHGKLDTALLADFMDYVHSRTFLAEAEINAAKEAGNWDITYGQDPARTVLERGTSALMGEGEPRLVSEGVESLLTQHQFEGTGVVFYGDNKGRIWYGAGEDTNIANIGSMTNRQMEGLARDFFKLGLSERLQELHGEGIALEEYEAATEEMKEIRAEDRQRNIKRSTTMNGDDVIHGYIRRGSWPRMMSGDMPDFYSPDPEDQEFIDDILDSPTFEIFEKQDGSGFAFRRPRAGGGHGARNEEEYLNLIFRGQDPGRVAGESLQATVGSEERMRRRELEEYYATPKEERRAEQRNKQEKQERKNFLIGKIRGLRRREPDSPEIEKYEKELEDINDLAKPAPAAADPLHRLHRGLVASDGTVIHTDAEFWALESKVRDELVDREGSQDLSRYDANVLRLEFPDGGVAVRPADGYEWVLSKEERTDETSAKSLKERFATKPEK